jgi:hypothetical protein
MQSKKKKEKAILTMGRYWAGPLEKASAARAGNPAIGDV